MPRNYNSWKWLVVYLIIYIVMYIIAAITILKLGYTVIKLKDYTQLLLFCLINFEVSTIIYLHKKIKL